MKIYSTRLKTLGAVGAGTLLVASLAAGTVLAQASTDEYPQIVTNIASTFDLNEAEVQQVFQDTREQHQSERLDALVADGTITAEQKDMILAKHEEMKAAMEAIKDNSDLTDDERHEQMRALHDDFASWAEGNGINLPFGRGHKGGFGAGRGGNFGGKW